VTSQNRGQFCINTRELHERLRARKEKERKRNEEKQIGYHTLGLRVNLENTKSSCVVRVLYPGAITYRFQ